MYVSSIKPVALESPKLSPIQSSLDYPDSLGLDEIVRLIEGPDVRKFEY